MKLWSMQFSLNSAVHFLTWESAVDRNFNEVTQAVAEVYPFCGQHTK